MIKYFAAWIKDEQGSFQTEGNSGNRGNLVEVTGPFPVTRSDRGRATRVTGLPKLPDKKEKGQPDFNNKNSQVPRVTQLTPPKGEIPALAPAECQEIQDWPPDTQRFFLAVLDHMEGQGFILSEAEALAYATMQALMRRNGCLIRFADNKMPDDLMEVVGAARDIFGGEVQTEWVPAPVSTIQDREANRDKLVRCCACQLFQPGTGDVQHALGRCLGRPWDGQVGQWPKGPHTCEGYNVKRVVHGDDHEAK